MSPSESSEPIGEGIEAFHDTDAVAIGLPAHRSGTGAVTADAARWAGQGAFRADVGMDKGIDDRLRSGQVQQHATDLFARAVGADQTWFSTNGSTSSVHAALLAAVAPGETVLMARNGHKSAFAALVLSGARPVYVDPVWDPRWEVAHGVEPAELDRVLTAHPQARAAIVFTPTYYGASADVRALADVAHAHGIPLLCDDAWALDHAFSSRLPATALEAGADLAIGSVHKSLSGLGQTSVLSVRGNRVDRARLQLAFDLEQSTSASALLMSSIDAARAQFERDGERLLGDALDRAARLRSAIAAMPGMDLLTEQELLASAGTVAFDPTHVTFDVLGLGVTGYAAADWLRAHRGVHVELADHRRLMVIVSYADDDATIDRLLAALTDLVTAPPEPCDVPAIPAPPAMRLPAVARPRDALLGPTEMVDPEQAASRTCAEMICPYPPGIPVAAPGEQLNQDVVEYLRHLVAAGAVVQGAADPSLERFRVVAH